MQGLLQIQALRLQLVVPFVLQGRMPLQVSQHVLIVRKASTRLVPPQARHLFLRVLYVLQVMQGL